MQSPLPQRSEGVSLLSLTKRLGVSDENDVLGLGSLSNSIDC